MRKKNSYFLCATILGTVLLAGCGEGYVTEAYYGVPYTEERTAHRGVAYVRAKMAPPAGPNVESVNLVKPEPYGPLYQPVVEDKEPGIPIQSAEPLFDQEAK